MGSLFDLCASRKNNGDEAILIDTSNDKEFCEKFQNGCVTNVTLPSGIKVPQKKYGRDWVIKGHKLVLQRRTTEENLNADFLFLIAPNDVGFAQYNKGQICTGKTLPSGFKVPEKKNGKDWVFDGGVIVLK